MIEEKVDHICTIPTRKSSTGVLSINPDAKWYKKWWWKFRRCFIISVLNPRSKLFYRSTVEIAKLRREQLVTHPHIIHPFSVFRLFYEMYLIAVFTVALVFAPVSTSFSTFYSENSSYFYLDNVVCTLCLLDVVMNFITGYVIEKDKRVEMRPIKIAKNYLLGIQFYCDFLSAIPEVTANYGIIRLINLGGLLRISRLPTVVNYISRLTDVPIFKTMHTAIRVFQYILISYILLHWFACLVFLVPHWKMFLSSSLHEQTLDSKSWISKDNLKRDNLIHIYIASLYRATSYLLCVDTVSERVKATEDVIVASFSYLFGKICLISMMVILLQLLLAQRSLTVKYQEKVSQLKAYMRQKQLPSPMQDRILTYYEYKFRGTFFKENVISQMLSEGLKKEINMHVCHNLVRNVTLFADLPLKMLQDVLAQLRVEIFLPNDLIIRAGTVGDCMYFLASGTVAVSTTSGKEVCHLENGAFFGEISLVIKDQKRIANIVALEICEVYRLDKKEFRIIFGANPDLLKNMEIVAQKRMAATQEVEDSQRHLFYRTLF